MKEEMMEFNEFMDKAVEALKQYYGTSAEVSLQTIVKLNDNVKHGVVIRATGNVTVVAPILYLEHYYEKLSKDGLCFEDVISEIEEDWKNEINAPKIEPIVSCLTDWEIAKEKVYPLLVSASMNKAMLQDLVTTDYLDMKVVYLLKFNMDFGKSCGTAKIKEEMLEKYDITVDELHEKAMENLRRDGFGFYRIEDILFNMTGDADEIQPVEEMDTPGLYCLCTSNRQYGSACLLDKELLEKTASGQNCYIIPSSIHEILVIPDNGEMRQEIIDAMIKNVNESEVAPDEVLSDHAYYYNAATGEIQLSA